MNFGSLSQGRSPLQYKYIQMSPMSCVGLYFLIIITNNNTILATVNSNELRLVEQVDRSVACF